MEIFNRLKNKFLSVLSAKNEAERTISMSKIIELFSGKAYGEISDLGEITYFTCLKTLSESVGKMPLYLMDGDKNRVKKHSTNYLFQVAPNMIQTPIQLFTTLEYYRNHYGNSYAYISKAPDGTIEAIIPLNPLRVQIWIENEEEFFNRNYYYYYNDDKTGKRYCFRPEEILHFKSWLTDDTGLAGKSVREILSESFSGLKASSKFLADLHQHGLIANAIVKHTGDLSKESQEVLLDRLEEQARDKGRRMITLPIGFDVQRLDLSLADSQFYELKKYSALQIAAAFGVQAFHLNNLDQSSYSNVEMQNLQFYTATLLYILSGYEQELNRKLLERKELEAGYKFKFNVGALLRGNIQQQADIIQKFVSCGVYSPNDARRWLDQPTIDSDKGGDQYLINGSMVALRDAGAAYRKGGESNAEDKKSDG